MRTTPSRQKKTAGKVAALAQPASTPITIEPYPSYCPTSNGQVYTFDDTCQWQDGEIAIINVNTGKVVGTMEYFWRSYSYWERSLLDMIQQVQVSEYGATGTGATPGVWQVTKGSTGCTIYTPGGVTCTLSHLDFTSPQKIENQVKSATAAAAYDTTFVAGKESRLFHTIQFGIQYVGPIPVANNTAWENDYPITYCDDNLPGINYGGCKAPTDLWTPTFSLSLAGYPTLARAIRDVQAKGAPGAPSSGQPLFRTTNTTIQGQNRAAACPAGASPPAGYSCDEYPGASTYEGAAYNPSSGITFSYCQNPRLSQTTVGPKWEACYVPASEENSSEGGLRNSFWVSYRTLDNDRFWEVVTS